MTKNKTLRVVLLPFNILLLPGPGPDYPSPELTNSFTSS